jgi:hypothetical protein
VDEAGVSRERFAAAVRAELGGDAAPFHCGYVRPLYLLPMFQKRIAIGGSGYPFNLAPGVDYSKGLCPVVERLHERELLFDDFLHSGMSRADIEHVAEAIDKVWRLSASLR